MLDSAGVAGQLWESWAPTSVRESIARETGLDIDAAGVLVEWLACVHDIGKAILTFQCQIGVRQDFEHFVERLGPRGSSCALRLSSSRDHGSTTPSRQ
jgi:hypothetical protein